MSQSFGSVAINFINIINGVYEGPGAFWGSKLTIDHQILLHKLEFYGIKGTPLKCFKSYLTNRKQYVKCNNINSLQQDITYMTNIQECQEGLLSYIFMNHSQCHYHTARGK